MLSSSGYIARQLNQRTVLENLIEQAAEPAMCFASDAPIIELQQHLKYRFTNNYIVQQFNVAMANSTIANALRTAEYDLGSSTQKNLKWRKSNDDKDMYTDATHLRHLRTIEGEEAITLTWFQESALQRTNNTRMIYGREYFFSTPLKECLFLSSQEIIFIPAPPSNDMDTLRYYEGMHRLYGLESYRQQMSSAFVRAVADEPEVVKLIGQLHNHDLREPEHELETKHTHNCFQVIDTVEECGIETHHTFQQQYWLPFLPYTANVGFFPSYVSYKKEKSLAEDILSMAFGENYCSDRRSKP